MKRAFVERKFELDGGELAVRFYTPALAPGGEFQCRYAISWPEGETGWTEREVRRPVCGLDGIQALMLAMRLAHTELVDSEAYKTGRLTWCDQADLDLPPAWGLGPLYDPPEPMAENI